MLLIVFFVFLFSFAWGGGLLLSGLGMTILHLVINAASKFCSRHRLICSVFIEPSCPQICFLPLLYFLCVIFPYLISISLYFYPLPSYFSHVYSIGYTQWVLLTWIIDTQYSLIDLWSNKQTNLIVFKEKNRIIGFQRCTANERILCDLLILHPKILCNLHRKEDW